MELEKQYRVLRTIKLVPEDAIIAAVNVEDFMDQPNQKLFEHVDETICMDACSF